MRIALAHDWLCGYRGGEAVLDAIARAAADAGHVVPRLYTMFDDGRPLTPTLDQLPRTVSPVNRLPGGPTRLRRWLFPLYPGAVAGLSRRLAADHERSPIDLVISTSSAAIKGLRPPAGVPHLCYCHAPARYAWSQGDQYGGRSPAARLRGAGLRLYGARFRAWDRRTAANVTTFLANSTHTQGEVRRCYGRESTVVFPPVRTDFFTPGGTPPHHTLAATRPWLVVSALEPYKRIDLAVGAANAAAHPLVIAGGGSGERELRALAGPTVTFEGRVSTDRLLSLYRTAGALLFPQVEDFGIVAAEALACGLPVAARGAGGALDIVEDGVTGALFPEPTVASLLGAIRAVGELPPSVVGACRAASLRFSEARFASAIVAEIARFESSAPAADR